MISGNHDFWFNDFFQKYINIPIYDKSYSLIADGKKMLFTHGDLHPEFDFRYKVFRQLIRYSGIKKLFAWVHPDLSLTITARLTRSSRMKSFMQPKKSAGLKKYAKHIINKEKYDYVCMGHSHQPEIMNLGSGKYINTGDWTRHHTYAEIIDGNVEIIHYK
jgi:UDP-2,3-diacylglucosamine hydrolase